jgi:hypothetical protein
MPVDPDDEIARRLGQRGIEPGGLDAAGIVQHPDEWVRRRDLSASIGGTAVGNQDLHDRRIRLGLNRAEAGGKLPFLIEHG